MSALLFGVEDIGLNVVGGGALVDGEGGEILEYVLGVEEFGIDVFGCKEVATNDEDFSRDVTAC